MINLCPEHGSDLCKQTLGAFKRMLLINECLVKTIFQDQDIEDLLRIDQDLFYDGSSGQVGKKIGKIVLPDHALAVVVQNDVRVRQTRRGPAGSG